MTTHEFFNSLWKDYIQITPQAEAVRQLFMGKGEEVINDHVAFRTFSESPLNLDKLQAVVESLGYKASEQYRFEQKKLLAKSYRHTEDEDAPKLFISELQVHELSQPVQKILRNVIGQIPADIELDPSIFWRGRLWEMPSFAEYETLRNESEYAAWLTTIGIRVNHFTVSINKLKRYDDIEQVNALLKQSGFALNSVGGEVKGSPDLLLEQSSTLADKITLTFSDGKVASIPSCFYEFAKRYPSADGRIFQGFIEGNADKIFESTNAR
ncbi:hypothetical protein ADIMK_0703 [Marinobacterium lacunae]|uniref:2-oxoadipate dioxygenase/decarboxylase n=1 Tax=Marinobacterium lacunae TaxID=1232683 RepID=A0A081G2J6_9GAMM|nr:DUF1338 domain-containing protein [Marinobacterium lacunae]KEA65001.1 hypothetical protein ADIMK_0703 [Marinobacterium lacunae]MBR9882321.1 DUF1338 domain-containing protein [Oceanospirillales bacterium]